VFLYEADRRGVVCHCWPGVRDDARANARFPTEYDSKGYGLMRLAGHSPKHWPVSSRPCDCRTSRPALHRVAWEARFLSHTHKTQLLHTHTTLLHANFLHTTRSHSFTTISQLPHTDNSCTHNCLTPIHHTFLTHTHTHNSSTYNFFNLSIPHHLLCLPFLPHPASTLVSHYWKKLTCVFFRWQTVLAFDKDLDSSLVDLASQLEICEHAKLARPDCDIPTA